MLVSRFMLILVLITLLAFPVAACSNDDTSETDGSNSSPNPSVSTTPSPTVEAPAEPITIKIGVITDQTGMAAQVMGTVDMALKDLVKYFNDENMIPGVTLEAIFYDGQYDASKDVLGYNWLREKGADLILANLPNTAATLKPFADDDEMVVFSLFSSEQAIADPGWIFCMNVPISAYSMTMLKWVAENDWDWQTNGPARIGGAGWTGPLWEEIQKGAEEYCNAHPEQFEWVGGYLTNFAMIWDAEVEALKDCDYVIPPGVGLVTFARQYRQENGRAKFLGFESQSTVLGLAAQTAGWDGLDGSLFMLPNRWWNEEAELSVLSNRLLNENHPEKAAEIRGSGSSYIGGITEWYGVLEIIAKTVEDYGAENFDSQALYDTASSFSTAYDACKEWNFSKEKRTSWNYVGIYELRAEDQDLMRHDPDWYPIIYTSNGI